MTVVTKKCYYNQIFQRIYFLTFFPGKLIGNYLSNMEPIKNQRNKIDQGKLPFLPEVRNCKICWVKCMSLELKKSSSKYLFFK